MLTVTFKAIGKQSTLDDHEYEWLLDNLNKPLMVAALNFERNSSTPWLITVYRHKGSVITVFVDSMQAKFIIGGTIITDNL
jgi:hypothetical protein